MSEKLNQTATPQFTLTTMVDAKKSQYIHTHTSHIYTYTRHSIYTYNIHERTPKIYILNAQKRETVEQATIYVSHSSKNKLIKK